MKALWLTLIAVLACGVSIAQTQSETSSATPQSSGASSQSVQGCLQQSGDAFILNVSGTLYRVVGGDTSQLKGLNGHTVSISGQKSGSEITLQSAQDISSTCESSSSTGTPSTQTGPTEDRSTPPSKKPPMSEKPPVEPPQAENSPIGSATSAVAEAANAEAANASKPVYESAKFAPQQADQPAEPQGSDRLPQSSSALPLLGLVGFGTLAAGLWRNGR